jgi:hypothetical protein
MTAARFAPSLTRPVLPDERYRVGPRIGPTRAEKRIQEEICDGTFRPPDAAKLATIEEAYALYVPFWRVDIQRTDSALRLSSMRVGNVGIPIPHQQTSDAKATWMVSARTTFPYKMKNPSTLIAGDAKPLVVNLAALEHGEPDTDGGWEVLDADVDEPKARHLAGGALATSSIGSGLTVMKESEYTVHAIHFIRYPVWFARYRYRGEAARPAIERDDLFYVGISAVDGAPITALHPSKLRAGAARIKKFFGLDE